MKKYFKSSLPKKIILCTLAGAVVSGIHLKPEHQDDYTSLRKLEARNVSQIRQLLSRIQTIAPAEAGSGLAYIQSAVNNIRNNIGLTIGYGSHAAYVTLVCRGVDPGVGVSCDGPPEIGLAGTVASFANNLQTVLKSAGIASCSAIPSSGTATGTDPSGTSVTLSFAAPTHSVPSGWYQAGTAFGKRVNMSMTISSIKTAVGLEFSCGSPNAYMAANMAVGSQAPGYFRYINGYFGTLSDGQGASELYISENNPTSALIRGAYAIRINYNAGTHDFNAWGVTATSLNGVSCQNGCSSTAVSKMAVHGDFITSQASLYYQMFDVANGNSGAINPTSVAAIAGSSTDTVNTSTSFDVASDLGDTTAGTSLDRQGCVSFTTPDAVITSTALCTGKSVTTPSAPLLDSSGKFSPNWLLDVTGGMTSKMEVEPLS